MVFCQRYVANSTGLDLSNMEMSEWRQNKQLREAVLREIEKLYPEQFANLQARFDETIKLMRRELEQASKA